MTRNSVDFMTELSQNYSERRCQYEHLNARKLILSVHHLKKLSSNDSHLALLRDSDMLFLVLEVFTSSIISLLKNTDIHDISSSMTHIFLMTTGK